MINSWDISRNVLHVKHRTIYIYVLFKGDICFTYQFLEDQKLKQERSCEVLKKKICFVRSYPLCPILPRFTVLLPLVISKFPQTWAADTAVKKLWIRLCTFFFLTTVQYSYNFPSGNLAFQKVSLNLKFFVIKGKLP